LPGAVSWSCESKSEEVRGATDVRSVAEAGLQAWDTSSQDEARDRCEALVGEIWEALGEAPEEATEDADEKRGGYLDL
jgi:hypothetical protein